MEEMMEEGLVRHFEHKEGVHPQYNHLLPHIKENIDIPYIELNERFIKNEIIEEGIVRQANALNNINIKEQKISNNLIKSENIATTSLFVVNYLILISVLCYNFYNNITLFNVCVGYLISFIIYVSILILSLALLKNEIKIFLGCLIFIIINLTYSIVIWYLVNSDNFRLVIQNLLLKYSFGICVFILNILLLNNKIFEKHINLKICFIASIFVLTVLYCGISKFS